ncbi:hypothetical protein [Microcoleus sp. FACHB-68]|uniref:hypothetical protein n=1 Tax=Microcoleus sp. FACHB-68 TaxID=2692826 RepID=UPI001F54E1FD|nr:hypothetical protein [Microcoleus sp. FACHB-68]
MSFEGFCNEMTGGWMFGYIDALKLAGGRTVLFCISARVREGCSAILCQEYEYARFDACVLLGQWLRLPVFATLQGGDFQMSRFEKPLRPLTLRACAGLIVATQTERERILSRYGISPAKVVQIFNPPDLGMWEAMDRTQARAALGIPSDAQVVVWHGRVDIHRKGLDVLLEAWKTVCRWGA